jgi:hypothetical protein
MKKVLIGSAIHDSKKYCIGDFVKCLSEIETNGKFEFDVCLADNSLDSDFLYETLEKFNKTNIETVLTFKDAWCSNCYSRVCDSHNSLRRTAILGGYDYLFILDCDIIIPNDLILKFINYDKEIVTGIYKLNKPERGNDIYSCARRSPILKNGFLYEDWLTSKDLKKGLAIQNGIFGTGCCLIKRNVLEAIGFRWGLCLHDTYYWRDLMQNGFLVYVDTDIELTHNYSDWNKLYKNDLEIAKKKKMFGSNIDEIIKERKKLEELAKVQFM